MRERRCGCEAGEAKPSSNECAWNQNIVVFWNSVQSFSIYSLGFSLVVSQHVAALLSSQAGVNDANKTSHQSIFYPHHCICKTTINYKASQKSLENPSTFWHLHCAPSLERTGQHDVCHSPYLYPAVYLKRCGQTVENHSRAKDTDRSHFSIQHPS